MQTLLITGTNTHSGKTILTLALAAYWQKYRPGRSLGVMKPIQTGYGDREQYHRLLKLDQSLTQINPIHFTAPLAPPLAAAQEGLSINLENLWQQFKSLHQSREFVLVEGLGGLGSPLTWETTVADLAWDWRLPTVLVVPVALGALGQAVAHVALARQCRVHLKGIILNCLHPCTGQEIRDWGNPKLMQALTDVPVLGCLPHLKQPTNLQHLAEAAAGLDLECLIPGP